MRIVIHIEIQNFVSQIEASFLESMLHFHMMASFSESKLCFHLVKAIHTRSFASSLVNSKLKFHFQNRSLISGNEAFFSGIKASIQETKLQIRTTKPEKEKEASVPEKGFDSENKASIPQFNGISTYLTNE